MMGKFRAACGEADGACFTGGKNRSLTRILLAHLQSGLSARKLPAEDACDVTEAFQRVLLPEQALPFHGVVDE